LLPRIGLGNGKEGEDGGKKPLEGVKKKQTKKRKVWGEAARLGVKKQEHQEEKCMKLEGGGEKKKIELGC